MAELSGDARIRDLKRRLELDPSSRLFVTLAEEYRKSGLLPEALSTLQKGLLAHPSYLSAHVALGRAYLEAGQITESIATFTKVLASDPGNLVSAKSLADIYLSRGESVEAIKKYKLYRALSGDRTVDEIVERLQVEMAPPPPSRPTDAPSLPPPPTFFDDKPTGPIRTSREIRFSGSSTKAEIGEATEIKPLSFDLDDSSPSRSRREAAMPLVPSRDIPISALERPTEPRPVAPAFAPPSFATGSSAALERTAPFPIPSLEPEKPATPAEDASDDVSTRAFRISDVLGGAQPEIPPPSVPPAPEASDGEERETSPSGEAQGRTLADLYFAQGHFAEALAIYDDLVAANPFDSELKRLRRDAEARLLPASSGPGLGIPDAGLSRRLAKVRALKRWLAMVQTG